MPKVKITHTTCNNIYEVEKTLNRWMENGWALSNVFIQMLKHDDGAVTIFHESYLDDDARNY